MARKKVAASEGSAFQQVLVGVIVTVVGGVVSAALIPYFAPSTEPAAAPPASAASAVLVWEPATVPPVPVVREAGLQVQVRSARQVGGDLTCELTLTSDTGVRDLTAHERAEIALDTGARLSNPQALINQPGGRARLDKRVPVTVQLVYRGVPREATRITSLTLRPASLSGRRIVVRDVPIQRQVAR